MSDQNGESHYQGNMLIIGNLRKCLEALTSTVGENPTSTEANLANLLLIELQKKRSEQLQKLSEKKDNKDEGDSSNLFKKLANIYPPTHNRVANA